MSDAQLGSLVAKLAADLTDLEKGLRDGVKGLTSFKDMAREAGSKVKEALTFVGVAVGLYEILGALKSFTTEAALTGARTETLEVSMLAVGKNAGLSREALKYFTEELKTAGVTSQEAMQAIINFLTAGLPLNELKDFATRARDVAVVAGKDTSETLNHMIHGIVSGQTEMLRTLHIPIRNAEDVWKEYAATLGKTKDEMTQVEKTLAMKNEVMRASARFAGLAAEADNTVGKQLGSLRRFAEEAKNALWALFGPVMGAGVQELTRGWKDLKAWAEANRESLKAWGEEAAAWIRWIVAVVRSTVDWIGRNQELVKGLGALLVLRSLIDLVSRLGIALVNVVTHVGSAVVAFRSLNAAASGLSLAFSGPLGVLLRIVGVLGVLGAYKTFKSPGSLLTEEGEPVADPFAAIAAGPAPAEPKPAAKPAGPRLTIPGTQSLQDKLAVWKQQGLTDEQIIAQFKAEADLAQKKALEEAPKPVGKAEKGGKETTDRLLGALLSMLKARREAELADAQNSLDLLKATNEKKRAELEKSLTEGLMDGRTYYQRLQDLQKEETAAALAMIDRKRQAQRKAYQDSLTELEDQEDLSPAAKVIAKQKLEAENRKNLAKLEAEAAQIRLEGEKSITHELKRQVELKQQYHQRAEDLQLETAQLLGAITEQEAKLQRLYLDWQRAKQEAIKAGAPPEYLQALEQNYQAKRQDVQQGGFASSITQGLSSLVDSLTSGTRDLLQAANNIFKSLFNDALKPGLEQLKNLLTSGFKDLFGAAGSSIGGALLGVIGLVGMLLTSNKGSSSWSASGVQSPVTAHEAVRGIIAGETSIPIAQIGVEIRDAFANSERYLAEIAENTRGGHGGGGMAVNVTASGLAGTIRQTIRDEMEKYFADVLMQGAGS